MLIYPEEIVADEFVKVLSGQSEYGKTYQSPACVNGLHS